MREDQAPPVVAVVVSADPGPWLEECLTALAEQDYTPLSILVVDAASEEPLAARVAAVRPDAYLHRIPDNLGFGPSANVALDLVEGAAFLLICHDDVVPDRDAVRKMVEEAFRSNAAVVAPKLVACDDPDRLLQLGLGVDRFAAPVRRVARREFDRAQHDEAREVFGAPGGCTLVRADLFAAIGGYDPRITMFGEDVDLSWRARLAGARVVVAPSARVRHHEATSSRKRSLPEARALQWRHELRAVLKNYGPLRRVLVTAQLLLLSVLEVCYFGLVGKRWRVRQVVAAWRWNLAPAQDLRGARAAVAGARRIPDKVVARLFTRRSTRLTRFVRPLLEDLVLRWGRPGGTAPASAARPDGRRVGLRTAAPGSERVPRRAAFAVAIAVLLLLFGSRSLIVGHLPVLGDFLPVPGPTSLIGRYLGGWTDAGLQHAGPATPAFAIVGLVGLLFGGAMGFVLKLGLVVCVVAGALGAGHLVRPFGSAPARVVAVLTYLYLPLAWNDLARADVPALAAYAAMPWVLARLARATGAAPFASPRVLATTSGQSLGARLRSGLSAEVLALGVLLAVAGAFAPVVVVLSLACAAALLAGALLLGEAATGVRAVVVCVLASLVAVGLDAPWSLTFFQAGARWSVLWGASPVTSRATHLSQLLSLSLGPIGRGPLAWAFLVASGFVLFVGRGERFSWATRWWSVALGLDALAWAASRGWLGAGGGASQALVAPAAVCIAALVALGAASLESDLRLAGFGWRHLAAVAFAVVAVVGVVPVLGASLGGRWDLPSTGYDSVLSWLDGAGRGASAQRVLWLGDPRALPATAWQLDPGLAAVVSSGGLPDATRVWPSSDPGAAAPVLDDVASAESGRTIRLGHLLASDGVRYIVVPGALAPVLKGIQSANAAPAPQVLLDGLAAQSDLHELPSEGGIVVFENSAWARGDGAPGAARGTSGLPAPLRSLGVAAALAGWLAIGGQRLRVRRRRLDDRPLHRSAGRVHLPHTSRGGAAAPTLAGESRAMLDDAVSPT